MTSTDTEVTETARHLLGFDNATHETRVGNYIIEVERTNPTFYRVSVKSTPGFTITRFGFSDFDNDTEAFEFAAELTAKVRAEADGVPQMAAAREQQNANLVEHQQNQARRLKLTDAMFEALQTAATSSDGTVDVSPAFNSRTLHKFVEAGLMDPIHERRRVNNGMSLTAGSITDAGRRRYASAAAHRAEMAKTQPQILAELLAA